VTAKNENITVNPYQIDGTCSEDDNYTVNEDGVSGVSTHWVS
jgi:hypothetical protein